jgi:MEMO1 family protein
MADRPAAHAGSWYPGRPDALARDVDEYVADASVPRTTTLHGIIAPHAGLMFSGRIAAYSYKTAAQSAYDVAVVVGPSHYVAFDGVSVWPDGTFMSPLGGVKVDAPTASALLAHSVAQSLPVAHGREHSLEMQLPFLRRLLPDVPIVPVVMGHQERATIDALANALVEIATGRRVLLVASSDLSHFFDAGTAQTLDAQVQRFVRDFDPDGLLDHFERYPEHERGRYVACGGGPAIAVMKAAKALGATAGRVLKYGHSGEVSGDNAGVVGYLAAGFGTFADAE